MTTIQTERFYAEQRAIQDEARELILCADNEGTIYAQRQAIERAALRRIREGTYDPTLGALGWKPYVNAYAKIYRATFNVTFSPRVRGEACRMLAARTPRLAADGELDYLLEGAK